MANPFNQGVMVKLFSANTVTRIHTIASRKDYWEVPMYKMALAYSEFFT